MAMARRGRTSRAFGAWALVWAIGSAAALAGEPAVLLERMNHALSTLDYEGTFAHWEGGQVQMLRIVHRMKNGVVSERLQSLDGSGREFIRIGSNLTCYLPDKREALVEQMPKGSSLIGTMPVLNKNTERFAGAAVLLALLALGPILLFLDHGLLDLLRDYTLERRLYIRLHRGVAEVAS